MHLFKIIDCILHVDILTGIGNWIFFFVDPTQSAISNIVWPCIPFMSANKWCSSHICTEIIVVDFSRSVSYKFTSNCTEPTLYYLLPSNGWEFKPLFEISFTLSDTSRLSHLQTSHTVNFYNINSRSTLCLKMCPHVMLHHLHHHVIFKGRVCNI